MTEERVVKTVNRLLVFASICLFYGITYYVTDEHSVHQKGKAPGKEENVSVPTYCEPKPVLPDLKALTDFKVPVYEKYIAIEAEYIGEYFVTAYCSEECGWSTATSSGEECEYHDEWYIPTTAAIDLNYHSYGEYLMIEGKIYRCSDTGPGVKGRWVDCYVPDMSSVYSWETGWKSVYRVTFTEKQRKVNEVSIHDYYNIDLQLDRFCDWNIRWDDPRARGG